MQWCDEGPAVFRSNQPNEYEILKVQLFNFYKTIQFMDTLSESIQATMNSFGWKRYILIIHVSV